MHLEQKRTSPGNSKGEKVSHLKIIYKMNIYSTLTPKLTFLNISVVTTDGRFQDVR